MSLKSNFGKYVVAEPNGDANANRAIASHYETWTLTFVDDYHVQFKSYHGKYLVAEPFTGKVNANRAVASHYETWTVVDKGAGKFAFQSYHGKYLVSETDGRLNADRYEAGAWETFEVNKKSC